MYKLILIILTLFTSNVSSSNSEKLESKLELELDALTKKVVSWRHDFHQFPELSNREFRTSKKVAEHLNLLGLEVTTGIAHTGVIAVLKGSQPGPMIALRADMDALPVTETTGLPFGTTYGTTT